MPRPYFPRPLDGGGLGWGWGQCATAVPCCTPLPDPPPQGGREATQRA